MTRELLLDAHIVAIQMELENRAKDFVDTFRLQDLTEMLTGIKNLLIIDVCEETIV